MDRQSVLQTGKTVIETEASGLTALAQGMGESFADAVQILAATSGRVIVSGIGKSGHIARKIAATLASTGRPAQFVHPAEANHGDLGMVTAGDVALVVSYSGEAAELGNLIAHTRRFAIPLIAITGRKDGTLARQSDVVLLLADAPEACATGFVPTTSTTMSLALGDALAVVLMQMRNFGHDEFRAFHPGGNLGARLKTVRELMHTDMPLVGPGVMMSEVLIAITGKGFGIAGVTGTDGGLVGVVTDGDLRRHMEGLLAMRAEDVMTRDPRTIGPQMLAEQAVALMQQSRITCLFIIDRAADSRPLGILHIHDCLRAGVV